MILYHTSTIEIRKPDILHSRSRLDLGIGFYLTPAISFMPQNSCRFKNLSVLLVVGAF